MSRRKSGGIYLIRCDKPSSFLHLSLPFVLFLVACGAAALHFATDLPWGLALPGVLLSGRHNAYAGMTNSYYHRERQHLYGSSHYGSAAKPFADLHPKFYKIMPLGEFLTKEKLIGRRIMQLIETAWIWATLPVYNVKQQAPWNLRKISSRTADAQRIRRMQHPLGYKILRAAGRFVVMGALLFVVGGTFYMSVRSK